VSVHTNRTALSTAAPAVIAAIVTFATPYATFIFQEYGRSIPLALDESARIDGASPMHLYFRIYLPPMAPALVAVGTSALLLAWNEYLYQFLLLSNKRSMTVAVALGQFLNSDQSPWNLMMATAFIYAIPPIVTYYVFCGKMTAGLTMGGVKRLSSAARHRASLACSWPDLSGHAHPSNAPWLLRRKRPGQAWPRAQAYAVQASRK
jgi:ABC-type glycerol-3-phosphate transport system permease component